MKNEKVLGWLPKNVVETYRVAEGFWADVPCTDIRIFYRAEPPTIEQVKEGGFITEGLKPSPKGLMMKNPDFVQLMEKFLIPQYEKLTKKKKASDAKKA